jgi:hypothetical protein
MSNFYGNWSSIEDMAHNFEVPVDTFNGCEILFATYDYGSYDGSAYVIFQKDNKFFEVEASHCSCYGLEQQWIPGEIVPEQLAKRSLYKAAPETIKALERVVVMLNAKSEA